MNQSKKEFVSSIERLSWPADRQLDTSSAGHSQVDQLSKACEALWHAEDFDIPVEAKPLVGEFRQMLRCMCGLNNAELWTDEAIRTRPEWADVRTKAVRILESMTDNTRALADEHNRMTPLRFPFWLRIILVLLTCLGGLATLFPFGAFGYISTLPALFSNDFHVNCASWMAVTYFVWFILCVGALTSRSGSRFVCWYVPLLTLLLVNFNGCIRIGERWPK